MLGLLDDLLIVPAGIWLVLRLIPAPIMAELRTRAETTAKPRSVAGMMAVGLIWCAMLVAAWLVYRHWAGVSE